MAASGTFIPNLLVGIEWEHSPEALAIVTVIGKAVEARAETLAPVRTGALKASITSASQGISTTAQAAIFATVEYGGFVEFGTSDTPAQPYLRPALDSVMKEA